MIHSNPELLQIVLHTTTILLIYAYVKEELQLPVVFVFSFTYFGIGRWAYQKIKHKHGISRTNYLLPVAIFIIFTSLFDRVLKNEYGM